MKLFRTFALAGALTIVQAEKSVAQVTITGGLIHERISSAGSEYDGIIGLKNDGPVSAQVRIYMTDYHFSADGKSTFNDAGTTSRSNARWVTLGVQSVTVPGHQTSNVPYRVRIPQQARDSSGSYWSVAMIEAEPSRANSRTGTVEIKTVIRQGVQIVTHVGTSAAAAISFANLRIVSDTTGPGLQFDAQNDGSRARKLMLSVDIYSENGQLVGKFTKQRGIVYPGCSIRQLFSLSGFGKGRYSAIVVADAGDDDLFAGTFQIVI